MDASRLKKAGIALTFIAVFYYFFFYEPSVTLPPGVMAKEPPVQEKVSSPTPFMIGEYRLNPFAKFSLKAKVLSKKYYSNGRQAETSPVDLALGWGPMSDEKVLEDFSIWQSYRFFHWRAKRLPIPMNKVIESCSNMHIIPANQYIKEAIDEAIKGDIIELSGNLVNVRGSNNWKWASSKSRKDTGNGACEIVYVENFAIVTPE